MMNSIMRNTTVMRIMLRYNESLAVGFLEDGDRILDDIGFLFDENMM